MGYAAFGYVNENEGARRSKVPEGRAALLKLNIAFPVRRETESKKTVTFEIDASDCIGKVAFFLLGQPVRSTRNDDINASLIRHHTLCSAEIYMGSGNLGPDADLLPLQISQNDFQRQNLSSRYQDGLCSKGCPAQTGAYANQTPNDAIAQFGSFLESTKYKPCESAFNKNLECATALLGGVGILSRGSKDDNRFRDAMAVYHQASFKDTPSKILELVEESHLFLARLTLSQRDWTRLQVNYQSSGHFEKRKVSIFQTLSRNSARLLREIFSGQVPRIKVALYSIFGAALEQV